MLVAQFGRAAQIDQPVGLGIKELHALARQPVIDVVDRVPIGPAPGEPVPLHRRLQITHVIGAIHDHAADPRVVGIGAVILDIPGFVPELFEPDQIVDRLPGDTGKRHLADKMQQDDFAALAHNGSGRR